MTPPAYCFHATFDPAPPAPFLMERHYLLYALSGVMRLEAEGRRWTLPPARAALIRAGAQIEVTLLTRLTTASTLFAPDMLTVPHPVTVFDMSPLARELTTAARPWTEDAPQTAYAETLFTMMAAEVTRLAATPSRCSLPRPTSTALIRAMDLTEAQLAEAPDFETIARNVGLSSRSLARRFASEMGMTWREALRRLRIIRAVELLAATDAPVTQVALDTGYSSLSAFNAAFREVMETTPRDYRRSLAETAQ
ncbi:helix-turn-helix domain-containing protein [Pseudooceanicola sp. C21-150M6]|uniref:AraC family transcriptional regulator n=1 Tax=Pseudooceanicola sp. C21-150M6 TaxID=3434355 RepID=UPI003D7F6457